MGKDRTDQSVSSKGGSISAGRDVTINPSNTPLSKAAAFAAIGAAVLALLSFFGFQLTRSDGGDDEGEVGAPAVSVPQDNAGDSSSGQPTTGQEADGEASNTSTVIEADSTSTTVVEPSSTEDAERSPQWSTCAETPVLPIQESSDGAIDDDGNGCPQLRVGFLAAFSAREVSYDLTAGQSIVMDHRTSGAIFAVEVLDPQGNTAVEGTSNGQNVYNWTAGADGPYIVRMTPDRQNSSAYIDIRMFDIG